MLAVVEMYAALVVVGLIGLSVTRGLKAAQSRFLAWRQASEDW
jgi:ABC-type nitrate/sulfonate/bicarbonate transport system permease component